jgi:hypothetical protein
MDSVYFPAEVFPMNILKALGAIAKVGEAVAPIAVTAVNPAAGAITSLVLNAVVKAEQAGGTGPQKREQVLASLGPMVAPLVASIMQAAGSKVKVDPNGVNQAVGQIADGIVALLNSMQVPAGQATTAGQGGTSNPTV